MPITIDIFSEAELFVGSFMKRTKKNVVLTTPLRMAAGTEASHAVFIRFDCENQANALSAIQNSLKDKRFSKGSKWTIWGNPFEVQEIIKPILRSSYTDGENAIHYYLAVIILTDPHQNQRPEPINEFLDRATTFSETTQRN